MVLLCFGIYPVMYENIVDADIAVQDVGILPGGLMTYVPRPEQIPDTPNLRSLT